MSHAANDEFMENAIEYAEAIAGNKQIDRVLENQIIAVIIEQIKSGDIQNMRHVEQTFNAYLMGE